MADQEGQATGEGAEPPKRTKERSPSFPFINLKQAIARAHEFYKNEGKNATPLEIAVTHWEYAAKSSGGLQTVAALRAFGLMESQQGKLKLTQRALRIILDERPESESPEKASAIRDAALSPPLIAELWKKYGVSLPSDATLKAQLQLERGFQSEAAKRLISVYKDTIAFAKLGSSDKLPAESNDQDQTKEGGIMEPGNTQPQGMEPSDPGRPAGAGSIWLKVPFQGATLSVKIEVYGQVLSKEHVARVRKYLELAEDDLEATGFLQKKKDTKPDPSVG